MAQYLALYKYKEKGVEHTRNGDACFSSLYHRLEKPENKVSEFTIYAVPKAGKMYGHDLIYSIEEIIKVFESFSGIIEMPEITAIKKSDIKSKANPNPSWLGQDDDGFAVQLNIKIEDKSAAYYKFIACLFRYFYECNGMYSNYVNIMERYLKYIDVEKYKSIPRIELFQLVHSNIDSGGGHGMFSCDPEKEVIPLKEDLFISKIKDKRICNINGHNSIFGQHRTNTKDMKKKENILSILNKYIGNNEIDNTIVDEKSNNIRSEEIF